jgi:hypothetical protein
MSDLLPIDSIGVALATSKGDWIAARCLSFSMACVWTDVGSRSPLERMGGIISGT